MLEVDENKLDKLKKYNMVYVEGDYVWLGRTREEYFPVMRIRKYESQTYSGYIFEMFNTNIQTLKVFKEMVEDKIFK